MEKNNGLKSCEKHFTNIKLLQNCEEIKWLMKGAVEKEGWPKVPDKVLNDNYPEEDLDLVGISYLTLQTSTK